jgi:hypothetical protein
MYIFVHAPQCHLRTGKALLSARSLCLPEGRNEFILEMLLMGNENKLRHHGVVS